jgi:hypothetical protein
MLSSSLHSHFSRAKGGDARRAGRARAARSDAPARPPRERFAGDRGSIACFARHYVEMVVVMFLGMFVLMAPAGWLFGALGTSWSRLSPAMSTFAMAMTMTAPMVGWMRYRGHAWRPNAEMAASMLIPTFAVMGVLWAGVADGGLGVIEHVGMLACMLIAMLLRRDEYSAAHHAMVRRAISA